jgi:hypothetical protein
VELNEKELEITTMRAGGKAASKLVKHSSSTSAASKEDLEIRALQRLLRQYLCGCTSKANTAVDDLEITRMRAAGTAASNLVKQASSTSAASSKDDLEITKMRAFGHISML